jgi:hypothetical protein
MTTEEIFEKLSGHMIVGMMVHEQFANYYCFLNLDGYAKCHEYHFLEETKSYRKMCRYYIDHYNKLISESRFENPDIIPSMWYKHEKCDADAATKIGAIKSGLRKWIEWETDTKKLYECLYKDLYEHGEISGALFVSELVRDVDDELAGATKELLDKEAICFDMAQIIDSQDSMRRKYKKKISHLF